MSINVMSINYTLEQLIALSQFGTDIGHLPFYPATAQRSRNIDLYHTNLNSSKSRSAVRLVQLASALTGHTYSTTYALQCATLALRRPTVSSNSSSQMALLEEIYYGAIYVEVLELTVPDSMWHCYVPNAG
jgi:hypothetical protein